MLLSAEEETVLLEAAEEFASARRALRLVLEEIWPDQTGEYHELKLGFVSRSAPLPPIVASAPNPQSWGKNQIAS